MSTASEKRTYARVYLDASRMLPCEGIGFAFSGKVSVLGLGGAMIQSEKSFPVGTVLTIRIASGADSVEAECVIRDAGADGLGVEFVKFRAHSESTLKKILERLQN
jgi:hypothetical protein